MRLFPSILICFAAAASAATIDFTFKGITAQASYNGAPLTTIDLTIDLRAETANLQTGGGWQASDCYLTLKGFVSSKALRLTRVEAAAPFDIHIGLPSDQPPFRKATVLLISGGVASGMFNMEALEAWNRVSSIGPLLGPATASGPMKIALTNGKTLSLTTFESAQPFGNASFQARLEPDPPVTGSLRKLREKDLVLATDDNTVLRFRLIAKTQFRDPQGAAIRDSLLRPGDQLSVTVNPDDPETALGVILIHKR